MRVKGLFWLTLVAVLVFTGCTTKVGPTPQQSETPAKTAAPAKQAWEAQWEKILSAAKGEGSVVVYTTAGSEVRGALAAAFKDRHNLNLEFVTGRSAELVEKLTRERQSGLFLSDVYIGGTTEQFSQFVAEGLSDPIPPVLVLPEVVDPKAWWGGKIWFADKKAEYTLCFVLYVSTAMAKNTDLVKSEEMRSYKDFLNPKWKGKIVMGDPTIPGSALRWFSVVGFKVMGLDFMRDLAKQEPTFSRDERAATEWTARGKYSILVGVKPDPITEFRKAGAPLGYILPSEGTWLTAGPGAISLINRAAHPNAARVFLNWLLTKEGQTAYSRAGGVQSARVDVPVEHLDAERLRDSAIKYFVSEDEEFLSKETQYTSSARDIFGSLLK